MRVEYVNRLPFLAITVKAFNALGRRSASKPRAERHRGTKSVPMFSKAFPTL